MSIDNIIFGKDSTERIVNISCVDGLAYVYQEYEHGIECTVYDHQVYALTNLQYDLSTRLKGNNYYKWKTPIIQQEYEDVYGKGIYKPRSKAEGYMLESGATYFKGMLIDEVSILSTDIETINLDPSLPNSKVVLISNTFRKNNNYIRKLFDINEFDSELDMIESWCNWVREIDPSIIIAHNGIQFDFPYLDTRYNLQTGSHLKLGRDSSEIKFDKKTSRKRKDGNQSYDYINIHIHGREIVDSMFMAITYDVKREFPSYGLKHIEKYLKLVDSNRIEWDFNKCSVEQALLRGGKDWQDFRQYCESDGDSPIQMFDIMAPSLFYLNRSIPKTFQQMINEATGSHIDSFMIRSYLQDGFSQPITTPKSEFQGAVSMGIPGIYTNVRKVDVASLYPSIMLHYEIYPKSKDPKKHFLQGLKYFRNERLLNKTKGETSKYHKDLSESQKIMINSMYGFMGTNYLLYNDPDGSDAVTRHGREIVQKGVQWATGGTLRHIVKNIKNEGKPNEEIQYKWQFYPGRTAGAGFILVNVDTDSFSYCDPKRLPTKNNFKEDRDALNTIFPELIRWEDDGVFEKVIIFKAKNYVLKKHKDWCKPSDFDANGNVKVIYKGASIRDQKKEPALRELMNEIINVLLSIPNTTEQNIIITNLYNRYCQEAFSISDIKRWLTKKTISKSVLSPKRKNEQNIFDAIDPTKVQCGDKVWLYTAKNNQGVSHLKLGDKFDNDADSWHYVKRVYNTVQILNNIINGELFIKYHNKKNQKILIDSIE